MLLQYGNTLCEIDWRIDEKIPLKYSRVYYVYSGEVEYRDANLKTFLKPGFIYIFPSSAVYSMKQNINNRLYCTFMHIDFFPFELTELIEIPVEKSPALKHILCSTAECIEENNANLINALADIFKLYCIEHEFFKLPDTRISNAISYIADHISEKITVRNLSSLCGYNVQYFVRLFRKCTGMAPYQYIIDYRLKEAKKMLRSNMSVSQIADMTGYSDIKTFSRSFRQNFGLSPSMYRKTYTIQP
jgi:AraC family transcriptional regulator, arabinose operon regulatory protein